MEGVFMRMLLAPLALFLAQQCLAADLIGGGQRVLGVHPLDETRVKITVQGESGADTYVVDCIGATWGFEGGTHQQVKADQRSQAIAERAYRTVEFKAALVGHSGAWKAPVQQKPQTNKKLRPTWVVSEPAESAEVREARAELRKPENAWAVNAVGEKAVLARLKDPDSASFRGQFVGRSGGACGEVNSKNSFGGFKGYQRYMASGGGLVFFEEEVDEDEFEKAWSKLCR